MLCCAVLLLLVCGSLAGSHPDFWTTSSTSSPGPGGRISHLERSRLTGRNMDEGGKYQPKGNKADILVPPAVRQDVTRHSLLPTYFCPFNRLRCPSTVRSSRRRSLPKMLSLNIFMPDLSKLSWRRRCYRPWRENNQTSGRQEDIHQKREAENTIHNT